MAQKTGFFRDFKMLFFTIMLVAGGAVDLLTLYLVFVLQVRLVDVFHFLGKFDFLGFEFIIRIAVAAGRHAAGVDDSRPLFDRLAAKRNVGETLRSRPGTVCAFRRGSGSRGPARFLGRFGWVVAFDTPEFSVIARFPALVAFLNDARVSQNVTVAAEKLGLGDVRRRKLEVQRRLLLGSPRRAE